MGSYWELRLECKMPREVCGQSFHPEREDSEAQGRHRLGDRKGDGGAGVRVPRREAART